MTYPFQVKAIHAPQLQSLFKASDDELARRNIVRMTVDQHPGYPCRISLEDAQIGEEVLLLPFTHHPANSPYQASGPIFIRQQVATAQCPPNTLPKMLDHRLLSIRAYDQAGIMIHAKTVKGADLSPLIQTLFSNPDIQYLQVHNAGPGCYNCQIDRLAIA